MRNEPLPLNERLVEQWGADNHELPINILIVDDESKNLTVLETVLNDLSYRLVRAGSADEALLALIADEFALLILDVRMPGMSGFELAQMIKSRRKTADVPIIFLTAYYNEDQHVIEGYDTGAVDYLLKPLNPAILRSKVAVFADLHRARRKSAMANLALLSEVRERRLAQDELRALNVSLEQRVTDRTNALMRTRTALTESGERYRSLFEGSLDAIFSIDCDGHFTSANPAALTLIGRTLAQLKESYFLDYCADEQKLLVARTFRATLVGRCSTTMDIVVVPANGKRRDLRISAVPTTVDGVVAGLSCIARDITESKRAEEHTKLLTAEVNHRAKNLLSVVQAIALVTAKSADPTTFAQIFSERIRGLAASQDLLVRNEWKGVDVGDLVRAQLFHFHDLFGTRVCLVGEPVALRPEASQGIGLALHELGTNAAKYGALSNSKGVVTISWQILTNPEPTFLLCWSEMGGPPVNPPTRSGFGQTVTGRMVEWAVDGKVALDFRASGLVWSVVAPVTTTLQGER